MKIARRCRNIIYANFAGTLIVDGAGVLLAAMGLLNPVFAALIHVRPSYCSSVTPRACSESGATPRVGTEDLHAYFRGLPSNCALHRVGRRGAASGRTQCARGRQTDGSQARESRTAGGIGGVPVHLSSLRMPSITGSSSHPTGVALGIYLFGPEAMPALALITLVFQALLLAHGGLTTLGANLFSLGIVGPWVTWLFLRLWIRAEKQPGPIFVATVAGDLATYLTTAVQLAGAYPSAHGGFLASFFKFAGIFFITQIPISIAEGMLTVALLSALSSTQMAALQGPAYSETKERRIGIRAVAAIGLLAGLVLAIAFANRHAAPVGSDDQAEGAIKILRPGIRPIATSFYTPGPIAESVLFAAQGAGGVGILWWALYSLRKARRQTGDRVKRHLHLHPHLNDIAFTNHWRHRNPWEKVLFGGGFLVVALLVPPMPGAIVIALIVSAAAIAGRANSAIELADGPVCSHLVRDPDGSRNPGSDRRFSWIGQRGLEQPAHCDWLAFAIHRRHLLPRLHRLDDAA